jgi:hypothetical protein
MILLVMANAIPKLQPQTVSQNFTTQPSQLAAKRPVTKDETQAKLETMLPESVLQGFKDAGARGALEAIQKLEGEELQNFANSVADASGVDAVRDTDNLKAQLKSPEGQEAFLKSAVRTFKAAMKNPESVQNNPQAFVREQVREQISEMSKAPSAAKNTEIAEKAAAAAPGIVKFELNANSSEKSSSAQRANFIAASQRKAA